MCKSMFLVFEYIHVCFVHRYKFPTYQLTCMIFAFIVHTQDAVNDDVNRTNMSKINLEYFPFALTNDHTCRGC